jgi:CubicO group peptidase (beta-lactamase class C family)
MRTALAPLLLLAGTSIGAANAKPAFICPHLDTTAARAMTGWQVPGLAIGVIQNGGLAYRKSYGVADVKTAAPVTDRTLFGIGSITKSMTALGFAISHVQKELPLVTPIRSALPYFPAGMTIRHLLSHQTGWPRHDALWYLNAYDRQTLPAKLSQLPRFAKPGSAFQYNNVPFAAVAEFISAASGRSWDDWIRAKILRPVGMTSAITRFSVFRNSPGRAIPYFPAREGRIVVDLRDTDPVSPAAGIYANIADMTRYTELLATDGVLDGKRIFPAEAVQQLRAPTSRGYGLGLRIGKWRGEALGFHPGFIDGYGARISILPGRKAGVVVLSNLSGETPVARIVSQTALDCLTGAAHTDWVARFGTRRPAPKPTEPPPPPKPLDRTAAIYAGFFDHPAYGRFDLQPSRNDGLSGKFHGRTFRLEYAGQDRWRLTETHWPLREGLLFAFDGLVAGRFSRLSTPLADGPTYRHKAGPITFERQVLSSPSKTPD